MSSVDKIVFSQLLGVDGKLQDVNFVIMDKSGEIQGELKAHKLILSLVSEVFERQFYGPMAELNKQAGIVNLNSSLPLFLAMKKTKTIGKNVSQWADKNEKGISC
jgi:hypothetical protein